MTKDFFQLNTPWFNVVSQDLFDGVKTSYDVDVVAAVKDVAEQNLEQCIELANLIMPEIRIVLGRQRRDYNLCDEFKPQYPVHEQAENIDDTPVHNLGM